MSDIELPDFYKGTLPLGDQRMFAKNPTDGVVMTGDWITVIEVLTDSAIANGSGSGFIPPPSYGHVTPLLDEVRKTWWSTAAEGFCPLCKRQSPICNAPPERHIGGLNFTDLAAHPWLFCADCHWHFRMIRVQTASPDEGPARLLRGGRMYPGPSTR